MTICIKCSCTDDRACIAGCHWTRVNDVPAEHHGKLHPPGDLGVCSRCEDHAHLPGFVLAGQFDEWNDELESESPIAEYTDESPLILPGDPGFFI
jgi:hypothetical protein